MEIRIAETGETRMIEYVDPASGDEIADTLMSDASFKWIEDEGRLVPCLLSKDFEWWDSILDRLWEAETAAKKLGVDWNDHSEVFYSDFEGEVGLKEAIVEEAKAKAEAGDEVR